MLPWFEQPAWQVGPLRIHAFGVMVAAALCLRFVISGAVILATAWACAGGGP